jgi:hypothetical protein
LLKYRNKIFIGVSQVWDCSRIIDDLSIIPNFEGKQGKVEVAQFLENLIAVVPYKIHTILTNNGQQFTNLSRRKIHSSIFGRVCNEHKQNTDPQNQCICGSMPDRAHEQNH